MKTPKSFCPDARNALALLNRRFRGLSDIKAHKRPVFNPRYKPEKDMFGRSTNTGEAQLCKLYNKANNIALDSMDNELFNIFERVFPDKNLFIQNALKYKQLLLDFIQINKAKKTIFCKKFDKELAENPSYIYLMSVSLNNLSKFRNNFPKENFKPLKGFINLDVYKNRIKFISKCGEKIAAMHEVFVKPSKNPEVVKIEKELVEKYGVKTAKLNDDIEAAKNILKAVTIAKKNGYCVSDKYIVSPLILNGGFNVRTCSGNTVILRSSELTSGLTKIIDETNMIFKKHCLMEGIEETKADEIINLYNDYINKSRKHPYYIALHETLHNVFGNSDFAMANIVPERFVDTAKKATAYGYTTNQKELYTELTTKALIEGLTPAEKELHGYVNIGRPIK